MITAHAVCNSIAHYLYMLSQELFIKHCVILHCISNWLTVVMRDGLTMHGALGTGWGGGQKIVNIRKLKFAVLVRIVRYLLHFNCHFLANAAVTRTII